MSESLGKTFELLTSTANANAIEVLIPALDLVDDHVRELALNALIRRRSTRGQVEVIRRLASFPPELREMVEGRVQEIEPALKQCLIHGDADLKKNGLDFIRRVEVFSQMSVLVQMLQDESNQHQEFTVETFRDLVNRLYEHLHLGSGHSGSDRKSGNVSKVCHDLLTTLDGASSKLNSFNHAEDIVEGILILGDVDNFAVKKVLVQSSPECKELAGNLLLRSIHPGVMQLICDCMSKNYPHPKAFEAIQKRVDVEFISHLLRWFPEKLSQIQQKNFQQVESISWLESGSLGLEVIPPSLQTSLIMFVTSTGLPNEIKTHVRQWLVRHGTPQGRMAAGDLFMSLGGPEVHNILFESLNADDPGVEAWATSQLRSQGIPEALSLLIERLDSSEDQVRNAAREELASFDVQRMLGIFDHLDVETCVRAGELMQKIDPDCVNQIRREMANPIRRKRIRAARCAEAMGVQEQVIPALVAMLEDSDSMVRRTGVEILGTARHIDAHQAIQNMKNDPSQRVREATMKALDNLRTTKT